MGGRNHQPCNKYLEASIQLSRHLSVAHADLELANVALEDVLLAELAHRPNSIDQVIEHLRSSERFLANSLECCQGLRDRMNANDFVDLPTLRDTDLQTLGMALVNGGLTRSAPWTLVSGLMRSGGFWKVLECFEHSLHQLGDMTRTLSTEVIALQEPEQYGKMLMILEENRPGNIKESFARLYSSWSEFQQVFLASSLLSTELWYRYTGKPSLCSSTNQQRATA